MISSRVHCMSDLQAEVIMNYHVGETVLSLQKTTLIPGGSESLVYTTLSGGIGILVPFTSHEVGKRPSLDDGNQTQLLM